TAAGTPCVECAIAADARVSPPLDDACADVRALAAASVAGSDVNNMPQGTLSPEGQQQRTRVLEPQDGQYLLLSSHA
ncbi:hypothetical protein QPL67_28185, partial [Escherichia coli]|uniref:hypothetical protein n=1 Tax=Escherichia coli TaxID=562 RepID=UPI002700D876